MPPQTVIGWIELDGENEADLVSSVDLLRREPSRPPRRDGTECAVIQFAVAGPEFLTADLFRLASDLQCHYARVVEQVAQARRAKRSVE